LDQVVLDRKQRIKKKEEKRKAKQIKKESLWNFIFKTLEHNLEEKNEIWTTTLP
jgi:hypothetical protein